MEDAYQKLASEGKNDVDNLVKWMKDTKVIESTKESEDKAKSLFSDVSDKKNVTLEKFKEVIAKIAGEQGKNVADLMGLLQGGLAGGAQAVANLFK